MMKNLVSIIKFVFLIMAWTFQMNLLSKFLKNSILTGPIESYCLACGCLLSSEEEAYTHIQEPSHVDKLWTLPRLANNNDCIIKVTSEWVIKTSDVSHCL